MTDRKDEPAPAGPFPLDSLREWHEAKFLDPANAQDRHFWRAYWEPLFSRIIALEKENAELKRMNADKANALKTWVDMVLALEKERDGLRASLERNK
jgi:hypothetical protein